ncbi:hypothetical protein TNCV_3204401 [Trichonephila clavipes]|nr:hypothetical protein TNCV_3204401 [Trichonephila clavipes]
MVAQRLTQITPPAATSDQLWQRVEAAWSAVPQEHIQSLLESMPRRVAAVDSDNENEINPPVLSSFEMRKIMKSMRSYLDAHSYDEMNKTKWTIPNNSLTI